MTKELDLFLQPDGFWCGRQLKNGQMAKHSRKITEEEIATMFTTMLNAVLTKTGRDKLLLKDSAGQMFVAAKVETDNGATHSE